jgi:molybdopterin converting factor subunit 1
MEVTIKYFGAIAEQTGVQEEQLNLAEVGTNLNDLREHCLKKYSGISELSFQLAVNQELEKATELKDGDEVAFLPPFAGG